MSTPADKAAQRILKMMADPAIHRVLLAVPPTDKEKCECLLEMMAEIITQEEIRPIVKKMAGSIGEHMDRIIVDAFTPADAARTTKPPPAASPSQVCDNGA